MFVWPPAPSLGWIHEIQTFRNNHSPKLCGRLQALLSSVPSTEAIHICFVLAPWRIHLPQKEKKQPTKQPCPGIWWTHAASSLHATAAIQIHFILGKRSLFSLSLPFAWCRRTQMNRDVNHDNPQAPGQHQLAVPQTLCSALNRKQNLFPKTLPKQLNKAFF